MNCANHPDAPAVAYCRTCGKALCGNCTRTVHGVVYCEGCLAARLEGTMPPGPLPAGMVNPPSTGPHPALAGILAGFFPFGVGAVYGGQYAKGLAHLLIFVGLIWGLSTGRGDVEPLLGIALGFFYVYQIIDAVRSAWAVRLGQPPPDPFGLGKTFSTGERATRSNVPTGALVLIGLGILFLLHTMDLWFFRFDRFWPLILVFIGGWLFAKRWGLIGEDQAVSCTCDRCRARGLMGPAVLVTLGLLFLIDQMISFGRTWPALLIVIGLIKVYQGNASDYGHVAGPPNISAGTPPPAVPSARADEVQPPPPSEVRNG